MNLIPVEILEFFIGAAVCVVRSLDWKSKGERSTRSSPTNRLHTAISFLMYFLDDSVAFPVKELEGIRTSISLCGKYDKYKVEL